MKYKSLRTKKKFWLLFYTSITCMKIIRCGPGTFAKMHISNIDNDFNVHPSFYGVLINNSDKCEIPLMSSSEHIISSYEDCQLNALF